MNQMMLKKIQNKIKLLKMSNIKTRYKRLLFLKMKSNKVTNKK